MGPGLRNRVDERPLLILALTLAAIFRNDMQARVFVEDVNCGTSGFFSLRRLTRKLAACTFWRRLPMATEAAESLGGPSSHADHSCHKGFTFG
ncbi:hypothetical protein RB195_019786 [Necator americanus]|uniref:Secreted protein n=1 Tax=Necator americanus TaxID=51031 RepID=A0ABR1CFR9_NECAM